MNEEGMKTHIGHIHASNVGTVIKSEGGDIRVDKMTLENVKQVADVDGGSLSIGSATLSNSQQNMSGGRFRRKAKFTGAPARCSACGHSYLSERYNIMNARFWAESRVQDLCPSCGSSNAYLAIGMLDFVNDSIAFIQGPDASRELVEGLLKKARMVLSSADELTDPRDVIPAKKLRAQKEPWTVDQKLKAWSIVAFVTVSALKSYDNDGLVKDISDWTGGILQSAYDSFQNVKGDHRDEAREEPGGAGDGNIVRVIEI